MLSYFGVILAFVYGPGSKETIVYLFILGLLFGMLNGDTQRFTEEGE